jgi:hypothetical protein
VSSFRKAVTKMIHESLSQKFSSSLGNDDEHGFSTFNNTLNLSSSLANNRQFSEKLEKTAENQRKNSKRKKDHPVRSKVAPSSRHGAQDDEDYEALLAMNRYYEQNCHRKYWKNTLNQHFSSQKASVRSLIKQTEQLCITEMKDYYKSEKRERQERIKEKTHYPSQKRKELLTSLLRQNGIGGVSDGPNRHPDKGTRGKRINSEQLEPELKEGTGMDMLEEIPLIKIEEKTEQSLKEYQINENFFIKLDENGRRLLDGGFAVPSNEVFLQSFSDHSPFSDHPAHALSPAGGPSSPRHTLQVFSRPTSAIPRPISPSQLARDEDFMIENTEEYHSNLKHSVVRQILPNLPCQYNRPKSATLQYMIHPHHIREQQQEASLPLFSTSLRPRSPTAPLPSSSGSSSSPRQKKKSFTASMSGKDDSPMIGDMIFEDKSIATFVLNEYQQTLQQNTTLKLDLTTEYPVDAYYHLLPPERRPLAASRDEVEGLGTSRSHWDLPENRNSLIRAGLHSKENEERKNRINKTRNKAPLHHFRNQHPYRKGGIAGGGPGGKEDMSVQLTLNSNNVSLIINEGDGTATGDPQRLHKNEQNGSNVYLPRLLYRIESQDELSSSFNSQYAVNYQTMTSYLLSQYSNPSVASATSSSNLSPLSTTRKKQSRPLSAAKRIIGNGNHIPTVLLARNRPQSSSAATRPTSNSSFLHKMSFQNQAKQ